MPDSRTLLTPKWIAPVEPAGTVLTDHGVVIKGSRIEAVLPTAQAIERYPDAVRHDLPHHLLIPGLVNLHCHAAMSLLRGAGDDLPLERWLSDRIWPIEARVLSDEFVYDGTVLAAREMLLSGITCFNDMYFFPEAVARAARALDMRVALAILAIDFPTVYAAGAAQYLQKGLALRDELAGEPRVSFCLAPHAPYTVSDETFRRVATLCGEIGLPIHCHVHETAGEITESLSRFGVRPLERLDRLGVVGPDLIAVHAVHVNDAEIDLLAARGATVAHCPHSNLKLGSGIAPTARMLKGGVAVGIGTDGSASNNRLDLIAETRTAALLAKGISGDATTWNAHQALAAATIHGARALGLGDQIGSILPGKQADLVAVDLSIDEMSPVYDPVSQLIYAAGREHVDQVWIDGVIVVTKRQLVAPRAKQALAEVTARIRLWQNRIGEIIPERPLHAGYG